MLKPATEINNCYLLQKKLGEDFCAEYWLALAVFSPNRFLLRFIKEKSPCRELQEAIRAEAIATYSLAADAIVPLIEVDYHQGRLFISTEYLDELFFNQWLTGPRNREPLAALEVALHLVGGVEYFHDRGSILGTLFPHNILVARQGRAGSDFRILKPGNCALLDAVRTAGTQDPVAAACLAPELRTGGAPSRAGDLYALGIMLLFLTGNGAPPDAITEADLRRLAVPEVFWPVLRRCTHPGPDQRYASCGDLRAGLVALRGLITPATPPPAPAVSPAVTRERPAMPVSEVRPEVLNYFQEISADYRSAQGLEAARAPTTAAKPAQPASAVPKSVPVPSRPLSAPTAAGQPEAEPEELEAVEEAGESPVLATAPGEPAGTKAAGTSEPALRWQYRRVQLTRVVEALEQAFRRAGRGNGDFRYIGEPEDRSGSELLAGVFERMAQAGLVVKIGPLGSAQATTVAGFVGAFSAALREPLQRESSRSRARFTRLLAQKGLDGYFGLASREPPAQTVGHDRIIEGFGLLGRRNKPLVILIRGSERIGGELAGFMHLLAQSIRHQQVCCFNLGRDFPPDLRSLKPESAPPPGRPPR